MPDENIQAFLLFLKPEDKKKAQEFIAARLNTVDPEDLDDLNGLVADTKRAMNQVQAGRARFRGASNAYAKVMVRLYDESLMGYAQLLQLGNRASTAKERELKNAQRAGLAAQPGGGDAILANQLAYEERREFLLELSEEEEGDALAFLQRRVEEMEFGQLMLFRDVTQRLLTWWESTQGQTDGLMLNQFGDIGTVHGRRTIRERHDEMKQGILAPFKNWFQNVNATFLRKRKEVAESAASGGPRRPT